MTLFTEVGLSIEILQQNHVGPILFREEAIFRREIAFEDKLSITAEVLKATPDYSRWSFRHEIMKDGSIVAAVITVDGAWIDTQKRKLAIPPAIVRDAFDQLPKAVAFEMRELAKKT